MPHRNPYTPHDVGGLTLSVRPIEPGKDSGFEIALEQLGTSIDATGEHHLIESEVSKAVLPLLTRLIQDRFHADAWESHDERGNPMLRITPPERQHRMRIESKRPFAPPADGQYVELKDTAMKEELSADAFDAFLAELARIIPDQAALRNAMEQHAARETAEQQALALLGETKHSLHAEREAHRRAASQIGHLLKPVIETLAKHEVLRNNELVDDITTALLDGYAALTDSERNDSRRQTESYVRHILQALSQHSAESRDDAALIDALRFEIGKAEQEKRNRSAA